MGIEKKLNCISSKICDLIGVLKRFQNEKELSDVVDAGYTPVHRKALKYIKKTAKSCKYPYYESKQEMLTAVEEFTRLWISAIHTPDLTSSEFRYLREIFKVYIIACSKYMEMA